MLPCSQKLTSLTTLTRIIANAFKAQTLLLHTSPTFTFHGSRDRLEDHAENNSGVETRPPPPPSSSGAKDDYFGAVHFIVNIVQRDFYMERTLNKLRISTAVLDSEMVYRVLRACHRHGTESLRFFHWVRSYKTSYRPTSVEVEELVKTLARTKKYESMWKLLDQMKTSLGLTVSPQTLCAVIEEYGKQGTLTVIDREIYLRRLLFSESLIHVL